MLLLFYLVESFLGKSLVANQILFQAGFTHSLPPLVNLLALLAHSVFKEKILYRFWNRLETEANDIARDRKHTNKRNGHVGEEHLVTY